MASIFTGTVFQGELKGKGAVAVKTVRSTKITMASVREFMAEIKVGRLSLVVPPCFLFVDLTQTSLESFPQVMASAPRAGKYDHGL